MPMTTEEMERASDEDLHVLVAQVRGCAVAYVPGGIPFCPCNGSPHGIPAQRTPMGVVFMPARLHRFPRDIATGYLKSKDLHVEQVDVSEGVPLVTIRMNAHGNIMFDTAIPVKMRSLELCLAIRGALKSVDDDFREVVRSYKKGNKSKPKDDIDRLLEGAEDSAEEDEETEW